MNFQTPLAKVKSESAARTGTKVHIHQKLTALALVPLCIWFVISIIMLVQHPMVRLPYFIVSPVNISLCIVFIMLFLYHGLLGIQMILQDYISCVTLRTFILLSIQFISVLSGVAAVVALFSLHIILRLVS